jgi:cysteine synthase A
MGAGMDGDNVECCSLRFSKEVPGVVDCLSLLYREWKDRVGPEMVSELQVSEELCLTLTRRLWSMGFPAGPSSGLNMAAALETKRRLGPASRVVTVFPDRMERYFSHRIFDGFRRQTDGAMRGA